MRTNLSMGLLVATFVAAGCGDDSGSGSGGGGDSGSGGDASTSTTSSSSTGTTSSTTSSSTSATSSSSSGMGGGAQDDFSDEFDDAGTTTDWALGPSDAFDAYDVDTTTSGHLNVVLGQYTFWHDENQGFFLYKTVTGDFAVRVRTAIDSIDNPGTVPTGSFHAAGIMARDPASGMGTESWIMYDLGRQNAVTPRGTRAANTAVDDTSQQLTASTGDVTSGELVMCRLGDSFHLFRRLDGEATWTETNTFDRDLPDDMQVGMAAHAGYAANPDLVATFDFARLTVPASLADCTADM